MLSELLKSLFIAHKETTLYHRYITTESIMPLLEKKSLKSLVDIIGSSVNNESICSVTIGSGPKKILLWSQMHGNESTTTKSLFDMINVLLSKNEFSEAILKSCTLKIIPILNPDGAKAYTRLNANAIDLNRDAQDLSQPESKVLRKAFNDFKPDFCFNLHGQRTIFSAGETRFPATVSFLAPAQDMDCTITENRKKAMELISITNANLQERIPNQVGIYDDVFNINCVGDTFQGMNVPTVLFEAGHCLEDYAREIVRQYIFESLLVGINHIASKEITGDKYEGYLKIPENKKLFFDIIIRNTSNLDLGIQYEERLIHNRVHFIPKIEKISNLSTYYGHKEINANKNKVLALDGSELKEGSENDFVSISNEKFALILKNNY